MGIKTKTFDFMRGRTFEFKNKVFRFRRYCRKPCCENPICRMIYELYETSTDFQKFNAMKQIMGIKDCVVEISVKRKVW